MRALKDMKTYAYTLKTLSPLILSPRSSQAFYKGIDYKEEAYDYNIIYPFYRYSDYSEFNPYDPSSPDNIKIDKYYIPGSSIKGALTSGSDDRSKSLSLFVDDINETEASDFKVMPLKKSQYFNLSEDAKIIPKIKSFFDKTVGFEYLNAEVTLSGKVRFSGDFDCLIQKSSDNTTAKCRNDIDALERYIKKIKNRKDYQDKNKQSDYDNVISEINEIKDHIAKFIKSSNHIILLGGYKGMIRSLNIPDENAQGAIFTTGKNIPLGFAEISNEGEAS